MAALPYNVSVSFGPTTTLKKVAVPAVALLLKSSAAGNAPRRFVFNPLENVTVEFVAAGGGATVLFFRMRETSIVPEPVTVQPAPSKERQMPSAVLPSPICPSHCKAVP